MYAYSTAVLYILVPNVLVIVFEIKLVCNEIYYYNIIYYDQSSRSHIVLLI